MLGRVVAALPVVVVVAADPAGWYPFGPAKWAAVTIATALVVVALGRRGELQLPGRAVVVWVAIVVLAVGAAVFGADGLYAWVGTPERHFGVLTWVLVAVWFVAGTQLSAVDRRVVARGCALAAVWVGAYAAVERWWRRPIELAEVSSRLGGPFGSAAYLGAACCLLVPMAMAVAVDGRQPRGWRVVGALGAVGAVVAFSGSGSRAAWFGMAVAVVVAAAASPRRIRRRFALAAIALAAVGAVSLLPRPGDLTAREHGAMSRLDEWRVAVNVVGEHPLLGAGPEGYRLALADAVDADYERVYGRQVLPDRAHSAPLDVAASLGVPAAVLFVALVAGVGVAAWRWCRRGHDPSWAVAVLAYLAAQLLLFPLAELDPLAWVLAGAVVGRGALHVPIGVAGRRVLAGAGAVAAVVAVVAGLTDVAADRLAKRGADAIGTAAGLADARRAVELRPDVVRYHLLKAAAADATGTLAGVDASVAATVDAAKVSGHDPIVRLRHAEALSRRAAITGAPVDVDRALEAWIDLVGEDAHCFACQLGLGRAAAAAGDADTAGRAWRAAAALTTTDPRPATLLAELERAER
jgi:O-antigen ligase